MALDPKSILSNLTNSPPSFTSGARADAFSDATTRVDYSTGSFSVGGSSNLNTLFWIAGAIALVFILKEFFKK